MPTIDLTNAAGTLAFAKQLFHRYVDDLAVDPNKAKVRLISGIQIAIRDAIETGATPVLYEDAPRRDCDSTQDGART